MLCRTPIGEEVSRGDLVKGYESEKDHFVPRDDDFETALIDLPTPRSWAKFLGAASIDLASSTLPFVALTAKPGGPPLVGHAIRTALIRHALSLPGGT